MREGKGISDSLDTYQLIVIPVAVKAYVCGFSCLAMRLLLAESHQTYWVVISLWSREGREQEWKESDGGQRGKETRLWSPWGWEWGTEGVNAREIRKERSLCQRPGCSSALLSLDQLIPGGLSYRPVTAASGCKRSTSGLIKDPGPEPTHQVLHPISTGRTWVDQVTQSSVTIRVPLQTEMRGQNIG